MAIDKFRKVSTQPATTLGASIDDKATVIQLISTAGVGTDTMVDVVIDRVDANGIKTPDKMEIVVGKVNNAGLIEAQRGKSGTTAQPHQIGATVEWSVSSRDQQNDLVDALLEVFDQNGEFLLAKLVEKLNSSDGATGNQLTNSKLLGDGIVQANAIPDGSILPEKLKNTILLRRAASGKVSQGPSSSDVEYNGMKLSTSGTNGAAIITTRENQVVQINFQNLTEFHIVPEAINTAASVKVQVSENNGSSWTTLIEQEIRTQNNGDWQSSRYRGGFDTTVFKFAKPSATDNRVRTVWNSAVGELASEVGNLRILEVIDRPDLTSIDQSIN